MNPEIKVTLINEDVWREFAPDTEMILTKTGRPLFPFLDYKIEGLSPDGLYSFEIQMERIDDRKYTFNHGKWHVANGKPVPGRANTVVHSIGYSCGADVMKAHISFDKLKITNKVEQQMPPLTILLETQCRYMPILIIKKMDRTTNTAIVVSKIGFTFTSFFAVSSYQNERIIQLKKKLNKYASGFLSKAEKEQRRKKNQKRSRANGDDDENPAQQGPRNKKACDQVAPSPNNFNPEPSNHSNFAISNQNTGLNASNQVAPLPNNFIPQISNENIGLNVCNQVVPLSDNFIPEISNDSNFAFSNQNTGLNASNQVSPLPNNFIPEISNHSISAISNENIGLNACNQVSPLPNNFDVMSGITNENIDPYAYQPNFNPNLCAPNLNNVTFPLQENEQYFNNQYQSFDTYSGYPSNYPTHDPSLNFQVNNFNQYPNQYFDNFQPYPQPTSFPAAQCPDSYDTSPLSSYSSF